MKPSRRLWLGHAARGAAAAAITAPLGAERINAIRLKFDIEARVPVNGLLTPGPLTFPPEVAAGLASGALEIRARYKFPIDGLDIFSVQVFIVPPSTPYPMPEPPPVTEPATVAYFEVEMDAMQTSDRPNASIAMAGPVIKTTGSPFGDLTGVLTYVNFQYIPGTPMRFRGVFGGSTGVITTNAPSGVGLLEWNYRMP